MRKIFLTSIIFLLLTNASFPQDSVSYSPQDTIRLKFTVRHGLDTSKFNVFPKTYSRKKISLVLSGGGARGIAQLGVLEAFEKNDIRIDNIVGTSIGSVIGGLYSSGYSIDEIRKILLRFNWNRALSLTNNYQRTSLFPEQKKIQDRSLLTIPLDGIKPVLIPSSFSNGQYLSRKINTLILNARYHPSKDFNDLKIPFATIATNIDNGKMDILTSGNLSEAIKASLTFPLLYTPIDIDGKNLVDGGLTANIPTGVAKKLGADFIIAVNSTSRLKSNEELKDPISTADQILSITMMQLNNLQLKDANVVITPDIGNYSSSNFKNIDYLISEGKDKAESLISNLKDQIDSLEKTDSKYFNNFVTNPHVIVKSEILNEFLSDTLNLLTNKQFERYISIERNLRMLYKTGLFGDLFAVVKREGLDAEIEYHFVRNPELENVTVIKSGYAFLDTAISRFKNQNTGKTIDLFRCRKFYDYLLGLLRENNFPFAEITKFYFNRNTGVLEIYINSGKIEGIELSGNRVTNDNVILREIKFESDQPVKRKELDESLSNVMSTNLFRQVSFDLDYDKENIDPLLKIRVVEKNTKALRFSLRADNERNLQFLLDLSDENLWGSAIEARLIAAGGLKNQLYEFQIKSNQFFSLPLTFNFNGYYSFIDINRYLQVIDSVKNEYNVINVGEYRDINTGLSFLLGTQLERLGTIFGQVFIEHQKTQDVKNSPDFNEDIKVLKLKLGGIFDTQDILPFPTKGSFLNFYYETAKNIYQSSFSYTKFYLNYNQYFPIAKSQTVKPRFIFGFADKTTPITEQFYLGGEKSFFGMVDFELRGRQILELSLEYRYLFPYKLFFDTYMSFRYDLGNVWQVTEDIRFKDLRHGLGLTAGFDTPVGEASFSVGRSFLIKKGLTEDSFIFGPYDYYFSIGYEL